MKTYTRREMIACLMAGGMVTAAGLWIPGQKLISIPKAQGLDWWQNEMFRVIGNTLEYVGPEHQGISIRELHDWLAEHKPLLIQENSMVTHHTDAMLEITDGFRVKNPEHLTGGSLIQDSGRPDWQQGADNKEIWSSVHAIGSDDLVTDKVYFTQGIKPRERVREDEDGLLGLR